MKRLWTACLVIISVLSQQTLVAENVPVVAAYSIQSNDVGAYVGKNVNDLVFSFILEMRSYKVSDLRAEPIPGDLTVPPGTDYLFYGNLSQQP